MKAKKTFLMILIAALAVTTLAAADISRDQALQAALSDAALDSSSVSRSRIERDRDDGIVVYEVEFFSGDWEYDYVISAADGSILSVSRDRFSRSGASNDIVLTEAEALQAAFTDSGASSDDYRIRLDRDDRRMAYEVSFTAGGWAYTYKIDAVDGFVLEADRERVPDQSDLISIDEATSLVLERVDGARAEDVRIREDRDDGRIIYEGSLWTDRYEYEFEIDAATGRFLDWERDRWD